MTNELIPGAGAGAGAVVVGLAPLPAEWPFPPLPEPLPFLVDNCREGRRPKTLAPATAALAGLVLRDWKCALTPAPGALLASFLIQLNSVTSGPITGAALNERVDAITDLLDDLPAILLTRKSLKSAAKTFKWFPGSAELEQFFQHDRFILRSTAFELELLAGLPAPPAPLPPPTPEELEAASRAVADLMAELGDGRPPVRTHVRFDMTGPEPVVAGTLDDRIAMSLRPQLPGQPLGVVTADLMDPDAKLGGLSVNLAALVDPGKSVLENLVNCGTAHGFAEHPVIRELRKTGSD